MIPYSKINKPLLVVYYHANHNLSDGSEKKKKEKVVFIDKKRLRALERGRRDRERNSVLQSEFKRKPESARLSLENDVIEVKKWKINPYREVSL